ncbi:MAG: ATP-binding protein, partial [Thermoguttaceae bacterium]
AGRGMELFPSDGTQLPFPVIVSTAHGEQRDAVEAMKAGAMDYVVKSADTLVEMHRVVERTLQQWDHIVERQKAEAALQKAHDELETRVGQRTAELTAVNQRLRDEIEERKHVEQTLRESETRLHATIENMPFDFFTIDEDGRYDRQNSHCRRQWGNIVGKRPEDVATDEKCLALWLDNNRRAFAGERVEGEVEFAHDGRKATYHNIIVPIRDNGRVCGILGMNIDITKRKRTEHQAQQRLAELAHVGRLNTMGGMIAELAHEINQPLFAITNYASACQECLAAHGGEDLGAIPDWLEKISLQACRTGEIIRRLNRFVRKTQPQQSTANINDLVANVVELMESTARLYQVQIELSIGQSLPSLLMDRIQIEQVIANLVQNAIDAMREMPTEQRRLTVETSLSENNEIRVAVRDSGKGITQAELDRVFDAFYTTKDDGMGMGLAICRSIVEDHDGRLQATRNPDQGTTFSFTLPVRIQQEPEYVRQDDRVCRG